MTTIKRLPAWFNLEGALDEEALAELQAVAAEAEELAPRVRALAIRAFRSLMPVEELDVADLDDLAELVEEVSGARRVKDALRALEHDLEAGRLDPPMDRPQWLPEEAARAHERYGGSWLADMAGEPLKWDERMAAWRAERAQHSEA